MATSLLERLRGSRREPVDRPGWRIFGLSMLILAVALALALGSADAARAGRSIAAGVMATSALALAAYVGVKLVPALARRTTLRWFVYQVDYRFTREGIIFIGGLVLIGLAALNTGNNLLFLVLACLLAAILVSGVVSRLVLSGVELNFELPEHIFAEQPVLATVELMNQKRWLPSFSLTVVGHSKKRPAQILSQPVYFPYLPRQGASRQKIELTFPRRGDYRQDSFGLRSRFPFGFLEKTRHIEAQVELVVYPHVEPTEQFYEVLPLLTGEMASFYRGRGHDLYSIREYVSTDSARQVDWKASAKRGTLMVREFAREDERRVMLVLDPFVAPPRAELGHMAAAEFEERFERAVSLAACIAWHFNEIHSVLQFRTDMLETQMAPAGEIIYEVLRELAYVQPKPRPDVESAGGRFLLDLAPAQEVFKIILTSRARGTVPTSLWTSSYFIFLESL